MRIDLHPQHLANVRWWNNLWQYDGQQDPVHQRGDEFGTEGGIIAL